MNLQMNLSLANEYINNFQKAKIITEKWMKDNIYCPNCGCLELVEFSNNMPVADFYCEHCFEQYELKSKKGETTGNKIVDGAYASMIERINSINNPNFFFLNYTNQFTVSNLIIIPKHFFVPEVIEKRKPLSSSARRTGWVGCNIDLSKIPVNGRIFLIKNFNITPKEEVHKKWSSTLFLKSSSMASRGWTLDIMNCLDRIVGDTFSLVNMYIFENQLRIKYPNNNHIKDKIRQQLQFLRDKGMVEFLGNGRYRKMH